MHIDEVVKLFRSVASRHRPLVKVAEVDDSQLDTELVLWSLDCETCWPPQNTTTPSIKTSLQSGTTALKAG
ncbi:hypothetical protein ElyMa_000795000 [Elysia marginata]|uniref:Uncharacterized protein n=1 Tax=Elysia marginata TaxID=1093978 RepID=A0AAV4GUT8_9GAST|nr:hypothetical protein ElyMa_000795000 [Elysia marginata]